MIPLGGLLSGLVGLLVDALQAVLDGVAALVNAVIENWPVGMPEMPEPPAQMADVLGWFMWGPIGIVTAGCMALLTLLLTVWVAVSVAQPVLRFLKIWD